MPNLTPTDEQVQIVEFAKTGQGHLLVEARAGAAKTSTLIMIAESQPDKTFLSLAFNKKIKDEMGERMPANVKAMTLNGCGYQAWRQFIGRRTRVDGRKNYFLLREEISRLEKHDQDEAWENFAETLKAIGQSKNAGYIAGKLSAAFRPITSESNFFDIHLDFIPSDLQRKLINAVSEKSWKQTLDGVLDFDDMLLGPAVAGVSFEYFDFILADEAQDFSMLNHVLLKKIVRARSRLIAVGDPCQAIYGFRGADEASMKRLGAMFDCTTLYLTICFRCAQAVVENARWRAPDMRWPDWAKPGLVLRPNEWATDDIPDGAAIICRNNAPIFSLAIQLLRGGRYPELAGRDIVKNMVAKMKKIGKPKLIRDHAMIAVDAWVKSEKLRVKDWRMLEDTAACMRVFIEETDTLGEAIAFAETLGQKSGRIQLMTGHRAKGLEFDTVFFLDAFLCRKDGQDPNIKYVIETRAQDKLVYVTSETFSLEAADDQDNERETAALS